MSEEEHIDDTGEENTEEEYINNTEEKSKDQPLQSSRKEKMLYRIIKSQGPKLLFFLAVILILLAIIAFSRRLNPNPDDPNTSNVIGFDAIHIYIMAFGTVFIIALLWFFTKIIFVDNKREFGIDSYKSIRGFWTFVLTADFLIAVYLLLDVALVNTYLSLPLTEAIWYINKYYTDAQLLATSTDLLAYANIRNNLFASLYILLLVFPMTMSLALLSRYGRKKMMDVKKANYQLYSSLIKFFAILTGVVAMFVFAYVITQTDESAGLLFIVIVILYGLINATFVISIILIEIFRRLFHFLGANVMMVLPIILLFYVLPITVWSAWDAMIIFSNGDVSSTIYAGNTIPELTNIALVWQILRLNSTAYLRILELDFALTIGVSALIIGFAEGYSIFSIVKAFLKGRAVTRSGSYVSKSPSSAVIRITRSFFLFAWFSLLWDKAVEIMQFLAAKFYLPLNFSFDLPKLFDFAYAISLDFITKNDFFLAIAILIIPSMIIINSSFKFLSVSLVLENINEDDQVYILLISSTFVLIVTKIFSDIAAIDSFQNTFKQLLPLQSIASTPYLAFAIHVFNNLEAVAFYAGVLYVIYMMLRQKRASKK